MHLQLERLIKTKNSTIGSLLIQPFENFYILEDVDRGLKQSMPLDEIARRKIKGKTAIPTGTYEIVISYSTKFKKNLPLLLNVPGFSGIRIHSGNTAIDTEGCLLPGLNKMVDAVTNSRDAFHEIFVAMIHATINEKIFITIK